MDFRAAKDLDMVLVVEALTKEFAQRFWKFIQQGKYRNRAKGNGKPQFSVSINQENQIIQL